MAAAPTTGILLLLDAKPRTHPRNKLRHPKWDSDKKNLIQTAEPAAVVDRVVATYHQVGKEKGNDPRKENPANKSHMLGADHL
jgi:hypothetical protein